MTTSSPTPCAVRHAPTTGRSLGCGHGPSHAHASEPHDHLHPAPHTHSLTGLEGHRPRERRALLLSLVLTSVVLVAEVLGGLWTGSLMLLSDGVHMLGHAVALGVSWVALWVAGRPRSSRSHYGLHRAEILGSLANALGLFALAGWIVAEAVHRFAHPTDLATREMLVIALVGLVTNVITAWLLARSGAEDLNTRSALLHMLGDLFSSVAVVAGGVILLFTDWTWLDPLLSVLVAVLVAVWSIGLLRASVNVLLERAPPGLEPEDVLHALRTSPGVEDVHDLHVWEITSGYVCLTAHVVVEDAPVSTTAALRERLNALLLERFGVAHVTLQLEASA